MRAPTQRAADLVNSNSADATAWLLRRTIDDASKILKDEEPNLDELRFIIDWADKTAGELLGSQVSYHQPSS
jgi:hypothetical protein